MITTTPRRKKCGEGDEKNAHPLFKKCSFFNEEVYKQTDDVAMEFLLAPVLADIFMVELENTDGTVLQEYLSFWKRYVTILYVL